MIVSTITFDDWDCKLRIHRPNGSAFLYERGIIQGLFYRDEDSHQLRFQLSAGREILKSRIIILLEIVRSMV